VKLSLPVKLSIAGVVLLAVLLSGLFLWTPLRMRYYRAKYFSGDVRQSATGCRGLLSFGGKGLSELQKLVKHEFQNSPDIRRVVVVNALLSIGEEGLVVLAGELDGGMGAAKFLSVHWAQADRPVKGEAGRHYPLRVAAEKGYSAVAGLFISKGAKVDAKGRYEWTPLHSAARWGHRNVAEVLVSNGATVDAKLTSGDTPLFCAARTGMVDIADFLISKDADIEAKNEKGRTPLYRAVMEKQKEFCEFLIDMGVDVNARDRHGWTPLHEAASGDIKIVKLLVAAGAGVNARDDIACTPLDVAADDNREEIVSFLTKKGAKELAVGERPEKTTPVTPPEKPVVEKPPTPRDISWHVSRIHSADKKTRIEAMAALLGMGKEGKEALQKELEPDGEEKDFIAEHGEKVNKRVKKDRNGCYPLHIAADKGMVDAAALLIAKGAGVNAKDTSGKMPLHYAASSGRMDVVLLFIEIGTDIDVKSGHDLTPLHYAIQRQKYGTVKLLIEKGADIEKPGDGRTALHWAICSYAPEITELLLNKGADINKKCKEGRTPLHRAVRLHDREAVKLLLEKGADVNAKLGTFGETPLDVAKKTGEAAIEKLLRDHGGSETADPFEELGRKKITPKIAQKIESNVLKFNSRNMKRRVAGIDGLLSLGRGGAEKLAELLPEGRDGVVFLLSVWNKVNGVIQWDDGKFRPPLHEAARRDYDFIEEILIARGADAGEDYVKFYENLGNSRGGEGDRKGAVKALTDLLKLELDNDRMYRAYCNRGTQRRYLKEYDLAIEDFTLAMDVKSGETGAYFSRAATKVAKGDYDGAIKDYSKLIRMKPGTPLYYNERGVAYVKKGKYALAVKDFSVALRLSPQFHTIRCNRGGTYRRMGKYRRSLKDLNEVLRHVPDNQTAIFYRSLTYYFMGRLEGAVADISRLIDHDEAKDPRSHVAVIYSCAWKARMGKIGEAKKDAEKYLKKMESEDWPMPIIWFFAGQIAEKELLVDAADNSDKKVAARQLCQAYFQAAQMRLANGDKEGAIDLFNKCIAMGIVKLNEYEYAEFELKRLGKEKTAEPEGTKTYVSKINLEDPKAIIEGVKGLINIGDKGKQILLEEFPDGKKAAQLLIENWDDLEGEVCDNEAILGIADMILGVILDIDNRAHSERDSNFRILHLAAWKNYVTLTKILLEDGCSPVELWESSIFPNPDQRFSIGVTANPLHIAALAGNTKIVEIILKDKKAADSVTPMGRNVLHFAAISGHVPTGKMIINNTSINMDAKATGWTPLHFAAHYDRKDFARFLINLGADLNSRTRSDETPLDIAHRYKHDRVAKFLRSRGARTGKELEKGRK